MDLLLVKVTGCKVIPLVGSNYVLTEPRTLQPGHTLIIFIHALHFMVAIKCRTSTYFAPGMSLIVRAYLKPYLGHMHRRK